MEIKKLVEAMKSATEDLYDCFGIRTIEAEAGNLQVGDSVPDSYDWDYDLDCSTRETTGETLPGACAIRINTDGLYLDGSDDEEAAQAIESALERAKIYFGAQVLLIGGKHGYVLGDDACEIIIRDADVIAILEG